MARQSLRQGCSWAQDPVRVAAAGALVGAPGFGGADAVLPQAAISSDAARKISVYILIMAVPSGSSFASCATLAHGERCSKRSIGASGAIWYDGRA
jgi:hypothetical protein